MAKQTPTACQTLTLSHNMQTSARDLRHDAAGREPATNLPEYCQLGGAKRTVILAGIVEAALHSAAVVDGMKVGAFSQDLATSITCELMM